MVTALVVLLVIAILFGFGFAVNALLWVALVLFVLWLLGWLISFGAGPGGPRRRWYYW